MQYMLLIYADEQAWEAFSPEEREAGMALYQSYSEMLRERGAFVAGEPLAPTTTATTVRNTDGTVLTTDGPYVETKEQLGGFFIVEAKDLDEAIEFAAACPGAHHGSVEVRPIPSM